ncbi:MAG: radical SAM protein [Lachnospiraceae bacterium]|nr:radical SAM protein [Lachnospiraceae bacterium]
MDIANLEQYLLLLKKDFNEIIQEQREIFEFENITFENSNINTEEFIHAISINSQKFKELLEIGSENDLLERYKGLTDYISYLDNGIRKKIEEKELLVLMHISLYLLNFNLFYKPLISEKSFKSQENEKAFVFRGEKDILYSLTPSMYRKNDLYDLGNLIDYDEIENVYDSTGLNEKYKTIFPKGEETDKDSRESKYSFYQQYASLSPMLDFSSNYETAKAFASENYDIDGCIYALRKELPSNNYESWPEKIDIKNINHKLTLSDTLCGRRIFYLTHVDFEFSYSVVGKTSRNDLIDILDGCYVFVNKAVLINNNLICPFTKEMFAIISFSAEEKRKYVFSQEAQRNLKKKQISKNLNNSFQIPVIDNYKNLKLKVASDVVYRKRNNKVILLKTDKSKTYNFVGSIGYILDFFKDDYRRVNDLIETIKKDFKGINASNLLSIKGMIKILVEEEILIKNNELVADFTPAILLSKGAFYKSEELTNCAFELTYRCNEKCKYCYCCTDDKDELSTEEIKNIIDQLYEMNVLELTFTGGDPFVRKDIFEILKYTYCKGFAFNIFTNGIALSDSDLLTIKALHPKTIHFSIHSHRAEIHDAFTQVKGSFEKTISVIKKCILLGLPTNIKFTVTNQNMEDVDGVLSFAEELGTTIQISTEVFSKNDGDSSTLQFCCYNQEKLFNVYDLEKKHIVVKCSEGHSDLQEYSEDGRICGAGDHGITINPYGDIYTCNSLPISIGNVREERISHIWNYSEELKKIRNIKWNMIQGCEKCNDKHLCNFCLGNAYTQNDGIIKQYDNACFYTQTRKHYYERKEALENDI